MTEDDLVQFGWAPGYYVGGRCLDCAELLWGTAKRARRCKPCAEAAFWKWQGIQNAPLVCDFPDIVP